MLRKGGPYVTLDSSSGLTVQSLTLTSKDHRQVRYALCEVAVEHLSLYLHGHTRAQQHGSFPQTPMWWAGEESVHISTC